MLTCLRLCPFSHLMGLVFFATQKLKFSVKF
uniref:Uncharacterized protein n=1 Tax=Rhizophora mucronata TaxID=61149 RepID=A0A2P2LZK6_RHIMU